MTVTELITRLRAQGIRIRAHNDELEIDAPKGALTPELRDELSRRKVELLRLLSWSRRSGRSIEIPLEPVARHKPLPLSWSQQRLWFLDQLEPNSSAYNISWTVRLKGELDQVALQIALNRLVSRHESLRTVFPAPDGAPVQKILPQLEVPIASEDMQGASDEKFRARLGFLAAQSFDLATGPLLRVTVIRLNPGEHVMLVLIHHIVADGASMRVLFRELAALYEGERAGQSVELPALPVQYADYAVWQREWLDGDEQDRQAAYWHDQLEGLPPLLELPWDRPRSQAMRYRGASVLRVLPGGLADQLRQLGRAHGCTLFMVMLSAFYVLLMRYSGRSDLVVGTPMGGRSRTELEGLIGFFINTVVLRTDLSGDPGFVALLQNVRAVALESHANQELPFEKLVEILEPQRELSYSPVFQVMFDLQEEPRWRLPVKDLEVVPEVVFSSRTSSFDLTLSVRQAETGLDAMFEYDTDLFDESTIERMAAHYQTLLEAIVLEPDQSISQLPLCSEAEQSALIETWGSLTAEYPAEQTLVGLVAEQAVKNPAANAIEHDGDNCSYAELDRKLGQLTHGLIEQGVRKNSVVAICGPRNPEFFVAQLAVLNAGAVVLPLDSDYPAERLAFMLKDSGAAHLLVASQFAARFADGEAGDAAILNLEQLLENSSGLSAHFPEIPVASDDLAFLLYTSGSTGQPKGVELTHRGFVNYIYQLGRKTAITSADRILQFASLSFDIAIEETFAALTHGATLVLRSEEMADSMQAFLDGCVREKISWVSLPTAWWHELCTALGTEVKQLPEDLRCVVIGGEKASEQAFRSWQRNAGTSIRLINTYGPTETSIVATWAELTHLNPDVAGELPIGHPVPNVRAWVLDEHLQPLPAGVPGELYIGGVGIARGYRDRPDLTEQQFIADPFAIDTKDRLYRTGDRARYTADGQLLFLGRQDRQIKLRGHRIEPAEVEATMGSLPGVQSAAVVLHSAANKDARLIAYAVGERPAHELAEELAVLLPAYMLPSAVINLDAMPLTANGKVDRNLLAARTPSFETKQNYVAPRNAIEAGLAAIWSDVLAIETIGIHDSFFELGGHSLLATRVVARVRDRLKLDLALRTIFSSPTIAGLSAALAQTSSSAVAQPIQKYSPADGLPPLSWAQERLWLLDQLEPQNVAYSLPWVARLRGELDEKYLQAAVGQLVERHAILRTRFGEQAGEPAQIVAPSLHVPLAIETLAGASHAEIQARLQELSQQPFDLHSGPLIRVHLLRISAADSVLLLLMHHIVADGWSIGLILKELSACYNGLAMGRPVSLPDLPLQYVDYAAWQRGSTGDDELFSQARYWEAQLGGAPPLLELPADYSRPAVQSFSGEWVSAHLDAASLARLKQLAVDADASLFMVLLAGFKSLVFRHTGRHDILVGTPIAGRPRTELESLIGCFLNTLVLRTRLDPEAAFAELLADIRHITLDAYENQDLPFEKLLEILKPDRSVAHAPVVQLMFNLHNAGNEKLALHDISIETFDVERNTAKFDLSVAVIEGDDGLQIGFEYSSDLFARATVERLMRHYLRLLTAVAEHPKLRIADVKLEECYQPPVLQHVHEPMPESVLESSLVEHFEAIVERFSERPAVEAGGLCWSYAQLNAAANVVAERLREFGLEGTQQPVGLLLGHDAPMLAGLLGVLKSGCAYVPLDRKAPAQRLASVIAAGELAAIVTVPELKDRLPASVSRIVTVSAHAQQKSENPGIYPHPDELAYVLFTSGSTGRPKGVMQTHRNVLHHVRTYSNALRISESDRLSLFSAYGFDAAVMDIFGALLNGACLFPVDVLEAGQEDQPADLINSLRLSICHATPTVFRFLFAADRSPRICATVRAVVLGGEAAVADDFELFKQYFLPPAVFVNGLGPSESTLAMQFIADHGTQLYGGVVPIGQPVADTEAVVLDAQGRPTFVSGELGIRSQYVSTGYWREPDLTRQKFIPDTHGSGKILYRSGDRVRRLADGQFAFMGRLDAQIKIRGHRIEPAEIQAGINALPGVKRSAVTLTGMPNEPRVLVAYVVGDFAAADIRAKLKQQLPDYLVPARFIALDELPLTPNGKLDRHALPKPDLPRIGDDAGPRTQTERELAAIWAELLHVERIGLHDDFFQLGGHSLLATQVIARIRNSMGRILPLRALFNCPTVLELANLLDESEPRDDRCPLQPRQKTAQLPPLSWAQQRLWFLDRLEPDSVTYNLHWAARLKGHLDARCLQQALNDLVARHESLRTIFSDGQDEPVQLILPELSIALRTESLIGASTERVHSRVVELIRQPFALQHAPLLRSYVLHVSDSESVLLLVLPHIVADGWSMGILFGELAQFYQDRIRNVETRLEPLPVQYADYAIWQREWLSGAELARQSKFWTENLADAPALLDLPLDFPRPPVQRFRGAWVSEEFSLELVQGLNELARQHGATLFMVLLAGFNVLLARYTGQQDLLIGTPIAGRRRVELEKLIGFFLNTLVLRTKVDGNPDFVEVLRRVRQTTLDAYEYQDLPFEKLLEILQPVRSSAHTPVVQVMFNLHNEPGDGLKLEGLEVQAFPIDRGTSKFDLSAALVERSTGLYAGFEYNTDLFERSTVETMLRDYRDLLASLVADPEKKIADYRFTQLANPPQLVVQHEASFEVDSTTTIVSRFAEMVASFPDNPAVRTRQRTWTYRELDRQANYIARRVLATAGQDCRVGVLLGHDELAVAALLGTLKAGCAYVPLDQNAPQARLAAIVNDAELAAILTDSERSRLLAEQPGVPVVQLDPAAAGKPDNVDLPSVQPGDPAYILFTSGSTGAPKGVMQTQGNVVRQMHAYSRALKIQAADRLTLLSAYGFDAAVMDIYGALLNGACLYPLDLRGETYSGALLDQMSQDQISILHATPTVFRFLMRQKVCRHDLTSVRAVVLGGEETLSSDFGLFKKQFAPPTLFINGLGPSESTLALQFFADHDTRLLGNMVPVGLPVEGVNIHLVDAAGQPAGISGEIVIESSCLSTGYWRQPELTAQHFSGVSQDESGTASKRRYRTGDHARVLPDGQFVFLGRTDNQVKVRGHRVELAEIETALTALPDVERCAVILHADGSESFAAPDARLIAYVVGQVTQAELRSQIRRVLPEYMVPAAFVTLDDLPLLANGKLDRSALPAPDWSRHESQSFIAPRTETEQRLATLWSEVLGVQQVGVNDDFFELGGHSLMAAQLVSRITDTMQVGLPLRRLFDSPTIAALAEHVDALQWALKMQHSE